MSKEVSRVFMFSVVLDGDILKFYGDGSYDIHREGNSERGSTSLWKIEGDDIFYRHTGDSGWNLVQKKISAYRLIMDGFSAYLVEELLLSEEGV
jgi:hypothetical protein